MRMMQLTRGLAQRLAVDAGNRSMRAAGRKAWSQADYNASVREFNTVWPLEKDYPWMKGARQ